MFCRKFFSASVVGALLVKSSVAKAESMTQEQDVVSSKIKEEEQWQVFSPKAQEIFRYLVKVNGYNTSQQMDLLRNTVAVKGIAKDGTLVSQKQ